MKISIRKIFFTLLLIVAGLVIMHLTPKTLSWTIHTKFSLEGESNVPTWFSSILLFSVSICSMAIYLSDISDKLKFNFLTRYFWFIFSMFYCFLSCDEAATIHEIIDRMFHIKWVYLYAPFAGIFFLICVYYIVIIRHNDSMLRNWILGGLILFAFGGMGAELVTHIFRPLPPLMQQLEIIFEEGLEMIGTIMVLIGCLKELSSKKIKIGDHYVTTQ